MYIFFKLPNIFSTTYLVINEFSKLIDFIINTSNCTENGHQIKSNNFKALEKLKSQIRESPRMTLEQFKYIVENNGEIEMLSNGIPKIAIKKKTATANFYTENQLKNFQSEKDLKRLLEINVNEATNTDLPAVFKYAYSSLLHMGWINEDVNNSLKRETTRYNNYSFFFEKKKKRLLIGIVC